MNIRTVVLTAPRPKKTLERTLASLQAAGWSLGGDAVSSIRLAADFVGEKYPLV